MTGKLYWRLKKNGKWTWRPVVLEGPVFWNFLESKGYTLFDIETKRFTHMELTMAYLEDE